MTAEVSLRTITCLGYVAGFVFWFFVNIRIKKYYRQHSATKNATAIANGKPKATNGRGGMDKFTEFPTQNTKITFGDRMMGWESPGGVQEAQLDSV